MEEFLVSNTCEFFFFLFCSLEFKIMRVALVLVSDFYQSTGYLNPKSLCKLMSLESCFYLDYLSIFSMLGVITPVVSKLMP